MLSTSADTRNSFPLRSRVSRYSRRSAYAIAGRIHSPQTGERGRIMATRPYQAHDVKLPAGHTLRYYEWPGSGSDDINLVLLHGSGSYALQWEWTVDQLSD